MLKITLKKTWENKYLLSDCKDEIPILVRYRVASRPAISGNLEKSGNFVALGKSQGNAREFQREIGKSEGILFERNEYCQSIFKIHSSGEQELVEPVHMSCMLMDFYLRIKMNLNCGIVFSFWIRKCNVTD